MTDESVPSADWVAVYYAMECSTRVEEPAFGDERAGTVTGVTTPSASDAGEETNQSSGVVQ